MRFLDEFWLWISGRLEQRLLGGAPRDGADMTQPNASVRRGRAWLALALALSLSAGAAAYARSTMFAPVIHYKTGYNAGPEAGLSTLNLVFDGDIPQYTYSSLRWWDPTLSYLSQRHPLVAIYINPPVRILRMLGLGPLDAIHVACAFVCALWTGLFFFLLARWGCRLLDATLFTVLAQISAGAMFWFPFPESYPGASVAIVLALILTLWPRGLSPVVRYTAVLALTLSMTVTNAVIGLIAAARNLALKTLWVAGVSAWFVVTMLWVLQKALFPSVEFFLPARSQGGLLFLPWPARIFDVAQVLLADAVVMPNFSVISGAERVPPSIAYRMMTIQHSVMGSGDAFSLIATACWLALLGLGLWSLRRAPSGLGNICAACAAALVGFHLIFGIETFLFVLHMLPFLMVLAAGVTFTSLRRVGIALALVVIVFGGWRNWSQFQAAAEVTRQVDAYARAFPGSLPTVDLLAPDPDPTAGQTLSR